MEITHSDSAAMALFHHHVGTLGWTHSHDTLLFEKERMGSAHVFATALVAVSGRYGVQRILTIRNSDG
jgi:hypothetical protein